MPVTTTNTLTYEIYGDALVATLAGAINEKNAPEYQSDLVAALEPARHVVLDLTEVDDVSGSGFRMLLHLYHLAASKGGETALVGLGDEIRDTVEATGFSEFFAVRDSLDEALEQVCRDSRGHATIPSTTFPATSVKRKSRPW